jgi:putative membrane protein
MTKFLIRWIIVAIALVATAYIVPGIEVQGNGIIAVLGMALILGFVNAIIRPILTLLSCGCIVATLGVFMLVINAVTLWLSSYIATNWFGLGFEVRGFWPALFGSIVVSLISFFLSLFVKDDKK